MREGVVTESALTATHAFGGAELRNVAKAERLLETMLSSPAVHSKRRFFASVLGLYSTYYNKRDTHLA